MGYNQREKCDQFLQAETKNWKEVKIMIFDAPQVKDKPYAERLEYLKKSTLYRNLY
jgi:hypothetical protein